jgi:Transposase DDE domain/Transposase domain (DUF772)
MRLSLFEQLSRFSHLMQSALFPALEAEVGELSETARRLIAILELIPLDRFIPCSRGWNGRPQRNRQAIASAFVAKAVYNLPRTSDLLERLSSDEQLRLICGWKRGESLPHESTFSRAFAEFAEMELAQFVHEALVRETQQGRLIGHIARDATAIEAREAFPLTRQQLEEKAAEKKVSERKAKKSLKGTKLGPPKRYKGGKPPRRPAKLDTRLHRQRTMKLDQMLKELPRHCAIGSKVSSRGHQQYWRGYKLHLDVADGQIPISAVLTGAHVHDSQVAIPLATMSSDRVTYCYELMDAAYDAAEILDHTRGMGHMPIVDPKNGGRKTKSTFLPGKQPRQLTWAESDRYRERTMVERVYGRLKDEFGGRHVRVRGAAKVMTHLMFGVLALTADQLLKLGPGIS